MMMMMMMVIETIVIMMMITVVIKLYAEEPTFRAAATRGCFNMYFSNGDICGLPSPHPKMSTKSAYYGSVNVIRVMQ